MSTGRILALAAAIALSALAVAIVYDRFADEQRHEQQAFKMELVEPDAPATYLNSTITTTGGDGE